MDRERARGFVYNQWYILQNWSEGTLIPDIKWKLWNIFSSSPSELKLFTLCSTLCSFSAPKIYYTVVYFENT